MVWGLPIPLPGCLAKKLPGFYEIKPNSTHLSESYSTHACFWLNSSDDFGGSLSEDMMTLSG